MGFIGARLVSRLVQVSHPSAVASHLILGGSVLGQLLCRFRRLHRTMCGFESSSGFLAKARWFAVCILTLFSFCSSSASVTVKVTSFRSDHQEPATPEATREVPASEETRRTSPSRGHR